MKINFKRVIFRRKYLWVSVLMSFLPVNKIVNIGIYRCLILSFLKTKLSINQYLERRLM
jgi:hypothetical protein